MKNKIAPCLWFDGQAEEAATFYTSVFKNSKILDTARYGDVGPGEKGSVMTVSFELNGEEFTALNGGPEFTFNEAISFQVKCDNQKEIDYFWTKLGAGGQEIECGWLKDRYGVAWQIFPTRLPELLSDPDPDRAGRAMEAMMKMKKIDLAELERAVDGAR